MDTKHSTKLQSASVFLLLLKSHIREIYVRRQVLLILVVPPMHVTVELPLLQVLFTHKLEVSIERRRDSMVQTDSNENVYFYIQLQVPVVLKIGLHSHV